ncbi:MAG: DegT/DnrJ/EryC1/StrS aminotransferase family protein [Clostridia bacterium]|nr:DegT/DnrJ/EryC1/StrS aminotransferase family protein [Clostridia bacterium]
MIPIAQPIIGEEEIQRVTEVLRSGELAAGRYVKRFEEKFTEFLGAAHGVAVSSGTTALHTALAALGIGPGDEVLTTPFSFIATANSILYVGARPIFVDIDEKTYNLAPGALEEACRRHPGAKGILLVHLYGHPAPMKEIMEVAERFGLKVIEDCAQAHGAVYGGKKVGTMGDAGIFSFYPTKNMTTGEGGLVVCQDEEVALLARRFVNHGQEVRYTHRELGYNFRMTNFQAAIGLAQLEKLPGFNERRRANGERLTAGINNPKIITPVEIPGCRHVYHQYTVRVKGPQGDKEREQFVEHLRQQGVGCQIHYPQVIYRQPVYQGLGLNGSCPVAEQAAREVVSLPVHPALGQGDLEQILQAVNSYR